MFILCYPPVLLGIVDAPMRDTRRAAGIKQCQRCTPRLNNGWVQRGKSSINILITEYRLYLHTYLYKLEKQLSEKQLLGRDIGSKDRPPDTDLRELEGIFE